jgi:hypothetical protein
MLAFSVMLGALLLAGLGSQGVMAAPAAASRPLGVARPLVGCAPCISQVSPADGSTATLDPDGKITISFSAQLVNNFSKFVFSLDNTQIDPAQIQVTDPDPTQPTGQYRAALSAGKHRAFVQVYDTNGPASAIGWTFTAPQAPTPTPTATRVPAAGPNGNNTGSSGGLFSPTTLSIILFSIAGVGLLVMVFIAGMWYGGRRSLGNSP